MENKQTYIGANLIKIVVEDPDDNESIIVTFENGKKNKLKKKLFDCIKRDVKGNGETVNEVANAYIGIKFLKDLADFGYKRYQITGIATAIGNLVHNLTEEKIGKKFGVNSSNDIKISDIL